MIKILKKNSYECLLVAALIAFILMKSHDIATPYFWDELGVYVPGALQMKDSGSIGLLPGDLVPLLSRGHPLLFTFFTASVFRIFGDSVLTGHLFSLALGLITLVLFFLFARKEFGPAIGFFSTILLMAQPIFFTLSGLILPEMMLTLFTILSIWGIIRERWVLYAIAGSLAMLTKESAIVIPLVALIVIFAGALRNHDLFTGKSIKLFLFGVFPLFVFGLFLIVQKIQNGWFLFPEHLGYIHSTSLFYGAKRIFLDLFIDQGRWMAGITFLAGIGLCFISNRLELNLKRKPLFIFTLFIILAYIFADVNYYLTRYVLYLIPFIILGGIYTAVRIFEKVFKNNRIVQLTLIVLFTFSGITLGHIHMADSVNSCDMSYKKIVTVCQEAISWTEKQPWKNDTINANFPVYQCLQDPRNGYLSGTALPFRPNQDKPNRYGLFFYLWESNNIPIGNQFKYKTIKTFSEFFANVAVVEFVKDSTAAGN
jgi:4-amino-4-deoxy-L-arabinose transferase-like glycosyltransferase